MTLSYGDAVGIGARARMLWLPMIVLVAGIATVAAHGSPAHPTQVALDIPTPSTTTSTTANTTTTASTATPVTAPAEPAPTMCPCNPVTGEPLGGSAVEKGVEGVVTDSSGQPIAGVCVTVNEHLNQPELRVTAVSAADGSYRIDLGAAHAVPLFGMTASSCDGSWDTWVPTSTNALDLDPNNYNHGVHVVLRRPASVTGTAVDQDGTPFASGCVQVSSPMRVVSVPVDSSGRFTALGVDPGDGFAEFHVSCDGPPPPSPDGSNPTYVSLQEGEIKSVAIVAYRAS